MGSWQRARASGFSLQDVRRGRAEPRARAVRVDKKAELPEGPSCFWTVAALTLRFRLYTLKDNRSTYVDHIRWFESPQLVVETLVLGPPDESGSTLHATSAPTASPVTGAFFRST